MGVDYIGVDVGSYAIKVAGLKASSKGYTIERLGSVYNPVGHVLPTEPARFRKLAEAIRDLFSQQKLSTKGVAIALPESMAFTSVISMPYLSDAELASSIHWEAEQHIPVALDDVNLEYEILYRPKKGDLGDKMKVMLVAARKEIVAREVELFNLAGIEVVGMETTMLSTYRSLLPVFENTVGGVMVCHIGALTTELLIVEDGSIVLTYSVATGGLALTRAIEKGLGLTPSQAEEYKRAYGLDPRHLEGKVRQALAPVTNLLVSEVRKALHFYQVAQTRQPIRLMLVSGGSAYLPELTSFLAQAFSFEVVLAQPHAGLQVDSHLSLPKDIAQFTPALGLAMKEDE